MFEADSVDSITVALLQPEAPPSVRRGLLSLRSTNLGTDAGAPTPHEQQPARAKEGQGGDECHLG